MGRRARLVGAMAVTLLLGTALVALAYRDRVLPGVRVAGIEIGGLTEDEARGRLGRIPTPTITLTGGALSETYADTDLGLAFDVDVGVRAAFAVGREDGVLTRLGDWLRTPFAGRDVGLPRIVADAPRLDLVLTALAGTVERPIVEGEVSIGGEGVRVREPQTGLALDRERLVDALLAAPVPSASVALPIVTIAPRLDADAIADARAAALAAYAPLTLVAGSERTTVDAPRVAALVRITEQDSGDGARLVASTDAAAVTALAADAATRLDGDAREAVLVPGGERLVVEPGRDGVRVDLAGAAAAIDRAVFTADRVATLPAAVEHPRLTTDAARATADRLVLVGSYTTYFPVNQARATNIGRAAATFDGTSVAPGESFSFWGRIGEVSTRTGYVMAGTIISGVSSYAIGGGLCQVSTTFFNAVIRGGYRIDERHPHSYYIERYPLGLDAAVFAGAADMRWTNDTAEPVLIRARGTATSVTFWLYSAPTGRSVEISDPVQWNIVWPSPTQPADPQHAPGYVVPGRDALVTRIVRQDGVEIYRDRWYSHYAPVWGGPAQ